MSPVLANLTLDGLEQRLRAQYPKANADHHRAKVNFIRWADDFVITGRSKELLEQEVKPLVETFLQERGLALSPEKTRITPIETGVDFLGQTIRRYPDGKVLTTPSKHSVATLLANVRDVIKANAQSKAGHLIVQLNPMIRGWANYHRHVCSKQTFNKIDSAIFRALWRWARRRHPNKPRRWVKSKYFPPAGRRQWVFSGVAERSDHQPKPVTLFRAAQVAIKRHVKIKGEANPYDPDWEIYFEQRLGVKMANQLTGRRQLLHLWREQNGLCPMCHQKITQISGWHNHHIVWRSHGGTEQANNRVLLHPECHRQVHHLEINVAKPRPTTGV